VNNRLTQEDRESPSSSYDVPMTRLQRAVARRMSAAKAEIPDFITEVDIDMVAAARLRAERTHEGGRLPSYNDLVIKACALALRRVPQVNASYAEDHFTLHPQINIGVAVASRGALVVPVIFGADRRSVREIAESTSALAAKVRDGSIKTDELAGGTFTVSNLGMFGVRRFVAVINPPQAAILAVGEVGDRVVARGGRAEVRAQMTVSLTADHRIVYGTDAASFLAAVRDALEAPYTLDGSPGTPTVSTDEKGWET
jgi:pyruvate dehydrogenase E2 component (dihydrolipoamide acetyltransferase)